MKKEEYLCDICKKEAKHKNLELQIIFLTEQQEGRNSEPYLDDAKIDLCDKCHQKLLKGNYIFARGAMGYNNYGFK